MIVCIIKFKVSFPNEMGQNSSKLMVYCLPPKVTPPIDYTACIASFDHDAKAMLGRWYVRVGHRVRYTGRLCLNYV